MSVIWVVMPKWGLSMESGRITEWLVSEGDEVAEGDELCEIDTEKIAGALESTADGTLCRVIAAVGEVVPVGATIALVADAAVAEAAVEEAARAAREELDAGVVEEVAGPEVGCVEVAGRSLAYARSGEAGTAVVLVHGFGGDKNSWLFVQEPLAADHVVDAIDLPGHGESATDVGDGSLATLAAAVTGYLDARGIDRAHLVGHSLGGAVVTAAAAAAPDRVLSLTLVAPAGFGAAVNAAYLRGFAGATSRRELQPHLRALFADESLATRQLADDLMRHKRLDGVAEALAALLGTLLTDDDRAGLDALSLLDGLDVPVMVVWGRQDAVLPFTNTAAFDGRRQAGQCEVRAVDDAGHMVHMERPSAVVEAVRALTRPR
ncbi:acetoin dehydrogenase dihydrolipoyllysine-residue acetyltransferase subunit [Xylanimonas ulmi]|uniref:Pyruvate dehydrogenase E2 component (Dihydrolipoamide acetyltransferase) n=1 Tax=Xylanimonas ulmi TaxID=228973 RepID=A0A4Q7M5V2_9MICO|nr:acetoin dehydrogenase dihydrolipoyllysine-residue acetyltransferase subunit [Xylanibacterium ulmi]RZS61968.1 pyruvate dehydrogenase E2 component (dihydrolipoamide acetyltransferase) [Xylanibacterium ulmi]